MYKNKNYKTLVIKSPTGSGKTYSLILNALYETFCFKKTSIIATKNKKLVDQIYLDCINLYQNQEVNGVKISTKKISIVKHTKENHLSKELLLDLFFKGEGIIITVHNYLVAFDDFYNVSFLNALSYMFPSLINIYVDEADYYLNNTYCSYSLIDTLTKHNDTLSKSTRFYLNQNWSETFSIEQAIKVFQPYYSKKTGTENVSTIKEDVPIFEKYEQPIIIENFDNNKPITIKLKNVQQPRQVDEIQLSKNNIKYESLTETKYILTVNPELKKNYQESKKEILIYNYLSTILNTIISIVDPRKSEEINSDFQKIIYLESDQKQDLLEELFKTLQWHVIFSYFERFLFLNEIEKKSFLEDFNNNFKIYRYMALSEKRLFNVKSIATGNECLLRLIYTSVEAYITFYYSHALMCTICLKNANENNNDYNFSILNVKEVKVKTKEILYETKYNSDKVKELIKSIKGKVLNKKKNNLVSDQGEDEEKNTLNENIYIKNIKADFEELKKIDINKFTKKEKKNILSELKYYFDNNTYLEDEEKDTDTVDVFLKIESPNEYAPFGAKIELHKDIDISRRLLGEVRVLTSANYDRNSLDIFSKFNKEFSKENSLLIKEIFKQKIKSERKIDKLYIFCNAFDFTNYQRKTEYIRKYWHVFSKLFYEFFYKNKNLKDKKFGMVGLPSQKKVELFYKKMSFDNYVCYISGNDQNTTIELQNFNDLNYTRNFNPSQKINESNSIVITSVFSTASIGLNMPHLFYLNVSLNNFKPKHTYSNVGIEINKRLVNPEYQTIQESLIQIIGRMTRFDEYSTNQVRILEIVKDPPLDNMLFFPVFITNLLKIFNNIYLISIEQQEEIFISLIYSKKFINYFNAYQREVLNNYVDPIKFEVCAEHFAEFKIDLIDLLKNNDQNENFNFLFKDCVKKYYKKIINIIYMGIIGQMYIYFCIDILKNNKKLTYSKFKDSMKLSRKEFFNDLYNYLQPFFDEFENSKVNKETFLEIYNLYKKESKFTLDDFINQKVEEAKFKIIEHY